MTNTLCPKAAGSAAVTGFKRLYLPAVDNYRARSTSVALVNLSEIKKRERKVIVIASLALSCLKCTGCYIDSGNNSFIYFFFLNNNNNNQNKCESWGTWGAVAWTKLMTAIIKGPNTTTKDAPSCQSIPLIWAQRERNLCRTLVNKLSIISGGVIVTCGWWMWWCDVVICRPPTH